MEIIYTRIDDTLIGYADANWALDTESCRSTSGYLFTYGGAAISWSSKKQPTVALSTAEAEYISLCSATQEAIHLRRILADIGEIICGPTRIWQDNQSTIRIANDFISNRRTKHIEIKYHFTREKIENGDIDVNYLPMNEMVADTLTKPVEPIVLARMLSTMFDHDVSLRGSVRNQVAHHCNPTPQDDMIDSLKEDSDERPTTTEEHGTPRRVDRRKSTVVNQNSTAAMELNCFTEQ